MTTEEVKGMIGKGVQTPDGSIQGKLTAMHGTCAVIKTATRTLWLDTSRFELVPYELPAEPVVAEPATPVAEQKPAEDNPAVTAVAETQAPVQQVAPAIKIEQLAAAEQKPAETTKDDTAPGVVRQPVPDAGMAQVPSIKWDAWREKVDGTLYEVLGFGWTVIYKGELCRVAWVATDGNLGVIYHKECLMMPIDSDDLT